MELYAAPAGIRRRAREWRVDFKRFTFPVRALIRLSPVKIGVACWVSRNETRAVARAPFAEIEQRHGEFQFVL
jgi:hypothetical protein